MKRIPFIAAVFVCLGLAQLGLTLVNSFASRLANTSHGDNWVLRFYNPAIPHEFLLLLAHAIGIAFVIALAVNVRHRWKFGPMTSLIAAGLLGAAVIPLVLSVVATLAFGEISEAQPTWIAVFWSAVDIMASRDSMIGHVLTALIASLYGVVFGRPLVSDPPDRFSFREVASHIVALITRRQRDIGMKLAAQK